MTSPDFSVPAPGAATRRAAFWWLGTFALGYTVAAVLLVITLLTPVPYGDLARLGRLSEEAFGWTTTAPIVDPSLLVSSPLAEADILVIGDSFSAGFRWQSVLVKAGYRVTTAHWEQFDHRLCADFGTWLTRSGFKGRLVILESAERLLAKRMHQTQACARSPKPFNASAKVYIRPPDRLDAQGFNTGATLFSGWLTWRNTLRAKRATTDIAVGDRLHVRHVPDGCKLFSHRVCDKALFLDEDELHGPLTPLTFDQMASFTRSQANTVPLLWMVIPNKTTVYLRPDFSAGFEALLDTPTGRRLGPNFYRFAKQRFRQETDFYWPNDTHWSMRTQLEAGEEMLQAVQQVLPPLPR